MPNDIVNIYNRHYVRVDDAGRVTRGFSDAFEQPIETDICINAEGGRHFELNGVVNPPLMTMDGIALYRVVEGAVEARTNDEIEADRAALPAPPPTVPERVEALETDNADIMEYAAENDYRICLLELGLTPEDF